MTTSSLSGRSWLRPSDSGLIASVRRMALSPVTTGVLLALVLGFAGTAFWQWSRAQRLNQQLQAFSEANAAESDALALIEEVGRLIDLPADETPTIATVADPEQLKSQPFFAKAKQGDRVLIYPKAGKAFLYDPVAKKVIEVGPITSGTTPNAEEHAPTNAR